MIDLEEAVSQPRRKKAYRIVHDMRIASRRFRAITLDEPALKDMLAGAAYVRVRGKLYKFHPEHDNPNGFGMADAQELPESLAGETVEFV